VIAHAFNDGRGPGVADREPLSGDAVEEGFAGCCAVEYDVANQDAFFRQEARCLRRVGDDAPAGKALAQIIVGIAFEFGG